MSLIPYAGHPALQANGADPGEMPESLRRPPMTPEQKEALAKKVVDAQAAEPRMPVKSDKPATPLEEVKKTKARNRIAMLKAKQSGELAKMPLTGKAALAAINAADPKPSGKLPVPPPSAKQDRAKEKDKAKPAQKGTAPKQRAATAAKKSPKAAKTPKSAKRTSKAPTGNGDGPRAGSKTALVAELLRRPEGCTTADILKATGWPACSVPALAKAAGVGLRKEKDGKVSRYWAASTRRGL